MKTSRRSFFGIIAGAVAAPAVLAEVASKPPEPAIPATLPGGWTITDHTYQGQPVYQRPVVIEMGGTFGGYQQDGGLYPRGVGMAYTVDYSTAEGRMLHYYELDRKRL